MSNEENHPLPPFGTDATDKRLTLIEVAQMEASNQRLIQVLCEVVRQLARIADVLEEFNDR